jgi:hypothetical protein
MRIGHLARPGLAAVLALAAVSPAFAGDPAVSKLNVKATVQGGHVEEEDAWLGLVQLTAPIAHAWGVQGEAGLFSLDGEEAYGLAAHAFTRDPAQYLLGGFAAWAHADGLDVDVGRIGIEGEYYLEKITLSANTGYQFGDGFIDDTWFGEVQASWYLDPDFALTGGVGFNDETAITHIAAEWLVGSGSSLPGLALRGDIYMGDNSYDAVMGGITYYFGPDATLMDRHRKQDPDSALVDLLNAVEAACELPQQVVTACAAALVPQGCAPPPVTTCGQVYYPPG